MILPSEQVRKLLSKLGFDRYEIRLWKDQIEIPIGVSMELFVIREVIMLWFVLSTFRPVPRAWI